MSAPKSAVTKAVAEVAEKAQDLDLRRQEQIANQVEVINRLMAENASLKAEISHLQSSRVGA
jgi:cell division protein FtsB